MTAELMVHAANVHKSFAGTPVLKGIDLEVGRGEVLCMLGPSGSGKSTLLRCINHLERIDRGLIRVGGDTIGYEHRQGRLHELPHRDVCRQRSEIGMVFQRFNLFPHMTATANITEAVVGVRGVSKREAAERAQRLLGDVGLAGRGDAYPAELSGGQQQRVAIARALAMEPKLMLFDEPTSALDPELVGDVLKVMRQLAHSGMTMIVVTHEIAFARDVADKVMFIADGLVVEEGAPDDVLVRPQQERTRSFLSQAA